MILLQVTTAEGRVFEHSPEADEIVIGRSSKADLTLPDRAMSRSHARLFRDGERWLVEDMGSRNGTFVNQQRVEGSMPVVNGDEIAIGGCRAWSSKWVAGCQMTRRSRSTRLDIVRSLPGRGARRLGGRGYGDEPRIEFSRAHGHPPSASKRYTRSCMHGSRKLLSSAFAALAGLILGCAVYVDPGGEGSCSDDICGENASCKGTVCVCDPGYDGFPEMEQGCMPTQPPPGIPR